MEFDIPVVSVSMIGGDDFYVLCKAVIAEGSEILGRWFVLMRNLLSEPSGLFWWPSLVVALVGFGIISCDSRSHALHKGSLSEYLKELPIDILCLCGYTLTQVVLAPAVLTMTVIGTSSVLLVFGVPQAQIDHPYVVDLSLALFVFVTTDLFLYWSHRLCHVLKPLWTMHRLHHQPMVLTPLTAFRFWPPETAFHLAAFALGEGIALGLSAELLGLTLAPIKFAGLNVFLAAWYLAFSHLRHSGVALYYPVSLSRWLVSPHMHQAHHSCDPLHHHRNFGTSLAIWDRLFGTLYIPDCDERFMFGLDSRGIQYKPI